MSRPHVRDLSMVTVYASRSPVGSVTDGRAASRPGTISADQTPHSSPPPTVCRLASQPRSTGMQRPKFSALRDAERLGARLRAAGLYVAQGREEAVARFVRICRSSSEVRAEGQLPWGLAMLTKLGLLAKARETRPDGKAYEVYDLSCFLKRLG
jgi:hypothetical protein